jgi:hypothetical protein
VVAYIVDLQSLWKIESEVENPRQSYTYVYEVLLGMNELFSEQQKLQIERGELVVNIRKL